MKARVAAGVLACAAAGAPQAAEVPLYATGPSDDASFLRFVNTGADTLTVTPEQGKGKLSLTTQARVSDYVAVKANTPIGGALASGGKSAPVRLSVAAGEFATVIGRAGAAPLIVREQPDEFNAMRASVAFYNVSGCAQAALRVAGREVDIVKGVAPGAMGRRLLNPVALKVQAVCAGKNAGEALDLGALQPGERYSVFLAEGGARPALFFARDRIAP